MTVDYVKEDESIFCVIFVPFLARMGEETHPNPGFLVRCFDWWLAYAPFDRQTGTYVYTYTYIRYLSHQVMEDTTVHPSKRTRDAATGHRGISRSRHASLSEICAVFYSFRIVRLRLVFVGVDIAGLLLL